MAVHPRDKHAAREWHAEHLYIGEWHTLHPCLNVEQRRTAAHSGERGLKVSDAFVEVLSI